MRVLQNTNESKYILNTFRGHFISFERSETELKFNTTSPIIKKFFNLLKKTFSYLFLILIDYLFYFNVFSITSLLLFLISCSYFSTKIHR